MIGRKLFQCALKLTYDFTKKNVSIKFLKQKSQFVLNNEVSTMDLCKQNAIINLIMELANHWLPKIAIRTLIDALLFYRAWNFF